MKLAQALQDREKAQRTSGVGMHGSSNQTDLPCSVSRDSAVVKLSQNERAREMTGMMNGSSEYGDFSMSHFKVRYAAAADGAVHKIVDGDSLRSLGPSHAVHAAAGVQPASGTAAVRRIDTGNEASVRGAAESQNSGCAGCSKELSGAVFTDVPLQSRRPLQSGPAFTREKECNRERTVLYAVTAGPWTSPAAL